MSSASSNTEYTYYVNLDKADLKRLKASEECALIDAWQKNQDYAAREKVLRHNLPFAVREASKYTKKWNHVPKADLTSMAVQGLIHAIERFDPSKGYKLITYAGRWIQAYINGGVKTTECSMRPPSNLIDKVFAGKMDDGGIVAGNVRGAFRLDAPIDDDESTRMTLLDTMADPNSYINDDLPFVDKLKSILTNDECTAITQLYGVDCEKQDISEIAATRRESKNDIRKLKKHILEKLRGSVKFKEMVTGRLSDTDDFFDDMVLEPAKKSRSKKKVEPVAEFVEEVYRLPPKVYGEQGCLF